MKHFSSQFHQFIDNLILSEAIEREVDGVKVEIEDDEWFLRDFVMILIEKMLNGEIVEDFIKKFSDLVSNFDKILKIISILAKFYNFWIFLS